MKLYYSILIADVILTAMMWVNHMATDSPAAKDFALVGIIIGTVMVLIEMVVSLWQK